MSKSAVAGILSSDGGLRTVVTQRWRMQGHVNRGERLFVVPDLFVDEPVPEEQIPAVIHAVHRHVVSALAPENTCGECRQCCITPYIAAGNGWRGPPKPSHVACDWCDREVGCLVYFNRPSPCRKFECLWLKSQGTNWEMGSELRPDRSGVIFTDSEPGDPEDLIYAHPDAHRAHLINESPAKDWIRDAEHTGLGRVRIVTHYRGEHGK